MTADTAFFPAIEQDFLEQALRESMEERKQRVRDHRQSMKCCWPQWDGNKQIKIGTRVECASVCNELAADAPKTCWHIALKKGEQHYTYMAPCKIVEVISAETFIAEIDYPPDAGNNCAEGFNGMKLKLDILDIWPCVHLLMAARDKRKGKAQ